MEKKKPTFNILKTVNEDMTVLEVYKNTITGKWRKIFDSSIEYLEEISNILERQEKFHGKWYPMKKDLFKAFELCPLEKLKVIIFGQDPYPQIGVDGEPRPVGMSFSVRKTDSIPRSLQNIYKEMSRDLGESFIIPNHGDLTSLAEQGILFLNASLTVDPGKPGSHGKIWTGFILNILNKLIFLKPKCIYVLWGNDAQFFRDYIKNEKFIIEGYHPTARGNFSFDGCAHFSKINKILKRENLEEIDWNKLSENE